MHNRLFHTFLCQLFPLLLFDISPDFTMIYVQALFCFKFFLLSFSRLFLLLSVAVWITQSQTCVVEGICKWFVLLRIDNCLILLRFLIAWCYCCSRELSDFLSLASNFLVYLLFQLIDFDNTTNFFHSFIATAQCIWKNLGLISRLILRKFFLRLSCTKDPFTNFTYAAFWSFLFRFRPII